eukprot:7042197-Pyramimonas_sp.AAC.1
MRDLLESLPKVQQDAGRAQSCSGRRSAIIAIHYDLVCGCHTALSHERLGHTRQHGLSLAFSHCGMMGLRSLP